MMNFVDLHFDGLATILTGGVAIFLYWLRRRDDLRSAASAILTEIQNAELFIDEIRNTRTIAILSTVLRTDYWSQFSHLVLGKLDFIEQREITRFYNACKIIQERISFLHKERMDQNSEGAREMQRQIVLLALNESDPAVYAAKRDQMTNRYHGEGYWFMQNDAKNTLFDAAMQVQKLSNSSIGQKLKKIARLK